MQNSVIKTFFQYLLSHISILFSGERYIFLKKRARFFLHFGSLIFIIAFILYGATYPKSEIFGTVTYTLKGAHDSVALTFDDGPNGSYTKRVLDILDEANVKATFFLIGKNVEYYPRLTAEIVRRGHAVGNHSYSHYWELPLKRTYTILKELEETDNAIFRAAGIRTRLFRPPHGYRSFWMISAAKKAGYRIITWDDMTLDFLPSRKPEHIRKAIVSKAKPGSIIVLHDGLNLAHEIDRENMILALPGIIEDLKKKGYKFTLLEM